MILITSGAYLVDEFISEVGFLPPSFLPIGNKRLYTYQFDLLNKLQDKIYLSYPKSYNISETDKKYFYNNNITTIPVPDGLTLGESISFCWDAIDTPKKQLSILHGDTFFNNIELDQGNCLTVHDNKGFYKRAALLNNKAFLSKYIDTKEKVISGYFSFENGKYFIDLLNSNQNDFVHALSHYNFETPLKQNTSGAWLDLGHINSFFQARSAITTQRAFNELKVNKRHIVKSSQENNEKIKSEAYWFKTLPQKLHMHIPPLLDISDSDPYSYQLEYLYLLPISDLMVFCDLNNNHWHAILSACKEVLDDFKQYKPKIKNLNTYNNIYQQKTESRLKTFQKQTGFDIYQNTLRYYGKEIGSLIEIMENSAAFISSTTENHVNIVHGDFCFSNILYDSRVQAIKLIDPRGIGNNGQCSIFGDTRYDLAKLYHSLVGYYDFIIAGCYELTSENNNYEIEFFDTQKVKESSAIYKNLFFNDVDEKEILAITIHLFLSMLPMHYDRPDRQKAFIANALRLYNKLVQWNK